MNVFQKKLYVLLLSVQIFGIVINNLKSQERAGYPDQSFGSIGLIYNNDYPGEISRFITSGYNSNIMLGQSFTNSNAVKLLYYYLDEGKMRYSSAFPYLTQMHNGEYHNGIVYFGGRGYKNDTICFYIGGYDFMNVKFADIGMDYNKDGTPDGYEIIKVGTSHSEGHDAIYIEDSKIVTVGMAYNGTQTDLAVVDYDLTKNTYKTATYNFGNDESAEAIIWEPITEKYYIGGYTANSSKYKFIVLRLNKDLTLDTLYGDKGKVIMDPLYGYNYGCQITDIALTQNNKLIVAGNYQIYGTQYQPVITKLKYNGERDSTFGIDGISLPNITSTTYVNSMVVQNDNKIICAGYLKQTSFDPVIFRLNEFGDLDLTFNSSGYFWTDILGGNEEIYDLSINSTGEIFGVGTITTDVKRAAIWKLKPDYFYCLKRSIELDYGNVLWLNRNKEPYMHCIFNGYLNNKYVFGYYDKYWGDSNYPQYPPFTLVEKYGGTIKATDLNNDNNPDILLNGNCSTPQTAAYINSGGWFEPISNTNPFINSNRITEAIDFNNDGRNDILNLESNNIRIYANINNADFELTKINTIETDYDKCIVADFDNDGDQDIFCSGAKLDYTNIRMHYYQNNNGKFTKFNVPWIPALYRCSMDYADLDSDGDFDIVCVGADSVGSPDISQKGFIIRNDGAPTFNKVNIDDFSVGYSQSLRCADIDNDGDYDIIQTGYSKMQRIFNIYRKSDFFLNYSKITDCAVSPAQKSVMDVADFDNDGDADLAISGTTLKKGELVPLCAIYKNNCKTKNNAPVINSAPEVTTTGQYAEITWGNATDDFTPANALTYNLLIKDLHGKIIVSPLSDLATGKRYISGHGNCGTSHIYKIYLEPGEYTAQIQAIDACYIGGNFSASTNFRISTTGSSNLHKTKGNIEVYPNPAKRMTKIYCNNNNTKAEVLVYSINGTEIFNFGILQLNSSGTQIDVSRFKKGLYLLKIMYNNDVKTEKLVIE